MDLEPGAADGHAEPAEGTVQAVGPGRRHAEQTRCRRQRAQHEDARRQHHQRRGGAQRRLQRVRPGV